MSAACSQPAANGPADFTLKVRVDPLFGAKDSAPFSGAYVTFEPGAHVDMTRILNSCATASGMLSLFNQSATPPALMALRSIAIPEALG